MRVLFLSQIVPYPPHGGVLQRGFNIVRELGRHTRLDLLAFVHPDELAPEKLAEGKRALEEFCERVEFFPLWAKASSVHKAAALALGLSSSRPFSVTAHRSPAFRNRVNDLLRRGETDVVHVDTVGLSEFVPERPSLPTLLTHHNVESMLMARRAAVEKGMLARTVLRRESAKLQAYEASTASRYHVHVTVSAPDADVLRQRIGGLRTAVVPNGVDTEYFTPDFETVPPPALVYTGGMNMFANRDAVLFFLDAIWPAIAAGHPEAKFVSIGEAPPAELQAAAARDPRIVALGRVPDIRPHVRGAAVYVVPLRVGGGTRLKVLDAMSMGKAIVSTSIGCEGLDVVPSQHLLTADDPATFAKTVIDLLRDRDRQLALGRAARALVEQRYAWPIIGQRLLAAYDEAAVAARLSK